MEDETPPEAPETSPSDNPEQPQWEYRRRFRIHDQMEEVVRRTIEATESELVVLRRKLDKLTYGS